MLAARLVECLPFATKLESLDNLEWDREGLPGRKGGAARGPNVQRDLLSQARTLLENSQPWSQPVVVVACRFATPASRRVASSVARTLGSKFLFVEARSHDIRALPRIPMSFLSPEDLKARMSRYERAHKDYRPLSRDEVRRLPGIRVATVLSDLDRAVERVLSAWRAGDAA